MSLHELELGLALQEIERLRAELAESEATIEHMRSAVQAYCDGENAARAELATAKELLRTVGTDDSPGMREWDARCDEFLTGEGPNEFQRLTKKFDEANAKLAAFFAKEGIGASSSGSSTFTKAKMP